MFEHVMLGIFFQSATNSWGRVIFGLQLFSMHMVTLGKFA